MRTKEQADAAWEAWNIANAPKTEHELQCRIVNFCNSISMRNVVRERFAAIPNGAFMGRDRRLAAIQAAKLKREGMRPGFPDMKFWREWQRVLYVETKNGKDGVLSKDQKAVHESLRTDGFEVIVVRDYETAVNAIREFYGV